MWIRHNYWMRLDIAGKVNFHVIGCDRFGSLVAAAAAAVGRPFSHLYFYCIDIVSELRRCSFLVFMIFLFGRANNAACPLFTCKFIYVYTMLLKWWKLKTFRCCSYYIFLFCSLSLLSHICNHNVFYYVFSFSLADAFTHLDCYSFPFCETTFMNSPIVG